MATKLEKKIVRESTVKVEDKEVLVSLNPDQTISMKLKGQRGEGESIAIETLYSQLTGVEVEDKKDDSKSTGGVAIIHEEETNKGFRKNPTVKQFLQDLRSHNAIASLDYETKAKFDSILIILFNRKNNQL